MYNVCTWSPQIEFFAVGQLGWSAHVQIMIRTLPCHVRGTLSILHISCSGLCNLIGTMNFLTDKHPMCLVLRTHPTLTLYIKEGLVCKTSHWLGCLVVSGCYFAVLHYLGRYCSIKVFELFPGHLQLINVSFWQTETCIIWWFGTQLLITAYSPMQFQSRVNVHC